MIENIFELALKYDTVRLSYSNRWLYWNEQWIVRTSDVMGATREEMLTGSRIIYSGNSKNEALEYLCGFVTSSFHCKWCGTKLPLQVIILENIVECVLCDKKNIIRIDHEDKITQELAE